MFLNELFSAFDGLMEKYGVFKVETIGDCFMCVSGHDGSLNHAARMLALAGEMLEVRTRAKLPVLAEADLAGVRRDVCQDFARGTVRVRIGLHSGSAVAGVVGGLMPRYCFFGDAVVRGCKACYLVARCACLTSRAARRTWLHAWSPPPSRSACT